MNKTKAKIKTKKQSNDVLLAIRVTETERKILKMFAAQDDTTIPMIVRKLIKKFIIDGRKPT